MKILLIIISACIFNLLNAQESTVSTIDFKREMLKIDFNYSIQGFNKNIIASNGIYGFGIAYGNELFDPFDNSNKFFHGDITYILFGNFYLKLPLSPFLCLLIISFTLLFCICLIYTKKLGQVNNTMQSSTIESTKQNKSSAPPYAGMSS
ncbi:MAG: hypothetical protein COA79_26680 [Planctomycetota bacterium]|nr:MAG: hypothetical protein COA79_26680 [Planctomycetota bacterium]